MLLTQQKSKLRAKYYKCFLKNCTKHWEVVAYTFKIPALWKQWQDDLCGFEGSRIYRESFRKTAKTTHRKIPALKKNIKAILSHSYWQKQRSKTNTKTHNRPDSICKLPPIT